LLYLIELDLSREGKHTLLIKSIYEKLEAETRADWDCDKKICIIVHMLRNVKYETATNLLEGWEMMMFDELKETTFEISEELMRTNTKQIMLQAELADFD